MILRFLYFTILFFLISCSNSLSELESLKDIVEVKKLEYESILKSRVLRILYKSEDEKIEGFIVLPRNFKEKKKYPVVIYNRGGNDRLGGFTKPSIFFDKLALDKYIVLISQYRGAGRSTGKDEFGGEDVNDVINLIKLSKKFNFVNNDKLYVLGVSRGGMMTFRLMSEGIKFNAAVSWAGPTDLFKNIERRPEMELKVLSRLIDNYYKNKDIELKKRSAIFWPEKINSPLLLLHGDIDWRVRASQSTNLAKLLKMMNKPYRLKVFENGDHGLTNHKDEVLSEIHHWFKKH